MVENDAGGWLPIETAPKDGTRIFVHGHNWGSPSIAYWHEGIIDSCTCWRDEGVRGWIDVCVMYALLGLDHDEDDLLLPNVTHWMPIPPYPTMSHSSD